MVPGLSRWPLLPHPDGTTTAWNKNRTKSYTATGPGPRRVTPATAVWIDQTKSPAGIIPVGDFDDE